MQVGNREVLAPGPRDYFAKQLPGVAVRHCGSVGSFTKAAEMMPVDFSGPAGRITSPTDLGTLLRMSFSRADEHGTKAVA
jgi:hypothetical protein